MNTVLSRDKVPISDDVSKITQNIVKIPRLGRQIIFALMFRHVPAP